MGQIKLNRALTTIGATDYAANLSGALREVIANPIGSPESIEQFLAGQADIDLSRYDKGFFKCTPSIESWLEDYLNKHEEEFIEWTP